VKTYEITYLTVQEEAADANTIASTLAGHQAKIVSVHPWGTRRKLAYPIKKEDQAFFTTVIFEAEPAALAPIDRALHLNNNVLRILILDFVPGYFHRATQTTEEAQTAKPAEVKEPVVAPVTEEKEVATVTTTEETPVESAPVAKETPTAEDKPKRKRATKKVTEEEQKALDEKLDALLNEDITK
jgi:small subunit ribosomal protein S6